MTLSSRKRLLIALGLVSLAGLAVWLRRSEDAPLLLHSVRDADGPGLIANDLEPSFELARHTVDTGGDERSRQLAIEWLDTRAREGQPLSYDQATWLLDTLGAGGHPTWESGYRQWFYNSAFNALHQSEEPQLLTRLLAQLAEKDPDRTVRLYALQHIGTQRLAGRLSGVAAIEIHALLQKLLDTDPAIGGTVIELLTGWEGERAPNDPAACQRAVAMVEDTTLGIDVRITAIHAAGSEALPAARRLSTAPDQPVLLRKAAIACIGRHGSEVDTATLKKLSQESSRLAQAADPALAAIRHRLSPPNAQEPTPL